MGSIRQIPIPMIRFVPAVVIATLFYTTTFAQVSRDPADDEQRIQATLRQATVFLTRAQLSARATATVDAGTTRLIIDNAPAQTDPQSIQVSGKGDAVIQGVQFRTNFLTKATNRHRCNGWKIRCASIAKPSKQWPCRRKSCRKRKNLF